MEESICGNWEWINKYPAFVSIPYLTWYRIIDVYLNQGEATKKRQTVWAYTHTRT